MKKYGAYLYPEHKRTMSQLVLYNSLDFHYLTDNKITVRPNSEEDKNTNRKIRHINPLCVSIEEMLARLEEFESLLSTVKYDTNVAIHSNIPQIVDFKDEFDNLCKRIDSLEGFLATVEKNLSILEKSVSVAETELRIPDHTLKGLLKPFFGKNKSATSTNLKDGQFVKPHVFKTSEYIPQDSPKLPQE